MTMGMSRVAMRGTIEHLYVQAGIDIPSGRKCIVPLGELIGCFNLVCTEIPHLTQHKAVQYLSRQGGMMETAEADASPLNDPLAGFLYVTPGFGCIFVEQGDFLVRRRFSVAHELGHYVLHFQPLLARAQLEHRYLEIFEAQQTKEDEMSEGSQEDGRIAVAEEGNLRQRLPPYAQMEREANQFAAELLMPPEVVRGLLARWITILRGVDLERRLASEMLVSVESLRWRLWDLGVDLSVLPSSSASLFEESAG